MYFITVRLKDNCKNTSIATNCAEGLKNLFIYGACLLRISIVEVHLVQVGQRAQRILG
jgi:hypothetical protein